MSYTTNDTQAPYGKPPGKQPPRWVLIGIGIAILAQLLRLFAHFINSIIP